MSTEADPAHVGLFSAVEEIGHGNTYTHMCVHTHDETAWYVDKHAPIYASDVITSTLT